MADLLGQGRKAGRLDELWRRHRFAGAVLVCYLALVLVAFVGFAVPELVPGVDQTEAREALPAVLVTLPWSLVGLLVDDQDTAGQWMVVAAGALLNIAVICVAAWRSHRQTLSAR